MDHHIFISYSRRDLEFTRRLRDDLRAEGLTVWMDEEGLEPGTPDWEDNIGTAISGAGAVIVILSPDSEQSDWVGRELAYAENFDVRIFPVLVRGDSRSAVPIRLSSHQRIDARRNYPAALDQLISAVCKHLNVESLSMQRKRLEQAEIERRTQEEMARIQADEERKRSARIEAQARRRALDRIRGRGRRRWLVRALLVGVMACLLIGLGAGALISLSARMPRGPYATSIQWGVTSRPTATSYQLYATATTIPMLPTAIYQPTALPVDYSTRNILVPALCGSDSLPTPPTDARAGDRIIFVVSWYATDTAYLQDFLAKVRYEVYVDGQLAHSLPDTVSDFMYDSPSGLWGVHAAFDHGALRAGTHRVSFRLRWTSAHFDGLSWYGPGTSTEFETGSCDFRVM